MANEDMKAAWDGDEGDHWAEHADWYDRAAGRVTDRYLEAIAPKSTESILDIGCGAGGLALALAPRAGRVHGVDLSSRMLEVAAKRAAERGVTNVTFSQADAQTDDLGSGYDVVVSSFGTMFFDDHVAAFRHIAEAVKPGGRVVLAVWRWLEENEWLMNIRGALALGRELGVPPNEAPTPFSLSNADRTTGILEAAGLGAVSLQPVDETFTVGTHADDAYAFLKDIGIVHGLTEELEDAQKAEALGNLRAMLAAHETPDGVQLQTASWIVTATKTS